MKEFISDILDCYGEEKIRLRKTPATSNQRIYALANTKAGKENVFMEKKHHRLPIVLAVVVAAVLMMGAGFAATSNSLTSFFQSRWQELTGEEMSQGQLEVIDEFSQEIESSQISNEITVTIDSAMASQNEMYFLLRMEGDCLQDVLVAGENWNFEYFYFGIKNAEITDYSSHLEWRYEEDGVYYWLWECDYNTLPEDVTSLTCSLSMGTLHSNYGEEDKDVVINGAWSFDFTVDVSEDTAESPATDSAQEIDASGTIESDITITVDSAIASKNDMYFLVKIEGESFMEMLDSGAEWYFKNIIFDIENANMAAYGTKNDWEWVEDGAYYMLFDADYSTIGDDVDSLICSLTMGKIYYYDEDGNQVFIGGPWTIDFTVDVADATYVSIDTGIEGISEFTISEFGVNYTIDATVASERHMVNIVAVMKDGSEVVTDSGWQYTGIVDGLTPTDGNEKTYIRQWAVLIDLDQVDYLYFVDVFGEMVEGTVIEVG